LGERAQGTGEPGSGLKMLRPLKTRDFALLWTGLTVSLIGDGMFFVALPLQVFKLSDSASVYSLILLAWTIPLVLLLIPAGVLSDRFDRRRLLMLSNTLQGIAIAVLGLLSLTSSIELWHIAVGVVVYGGAEALFGPAFGAIVPDIVPHDQLVEANALDNFSRPFSLRVAGPAIGGLIVAVFGIGQAFLIDAVTFGLANIFLFMMQPRIAHREEGEVIHLSDAREGFAFVRAHRWLWGALLSSAFGLLVFYGPWQALVPHLVTHKLGGSESDFGLVLAIGGLGALSASVFIGQRNLPRRSLRTMYTVMAAGTLMLTGFGLSSRLWQVVIASFFLQALFTTGIIIWNTTMHREVPGDILGRVSSLDWLVSTSLIPISLALTGPLASLLGEDTTLIFAGLLGSVAIVSFLIIPGVLDLDDPTRKTPPPPPDSPSEPGDASQKHSVIVPPPATPEWTFFPDDDPE
jgi:MFS family permease